MKINTKILQAIKEAQDKPDYIEQLNTELKSVKGITTKVFRWPVSAKNRNERFEIIITYSDNRNISNMFRGEYSYDGVNNATINLTHSSLMTVKGFFAAANLQLAVDTFIKYTKSENGLTGIVKLFDKIGEIKKDLKELEKVDITKL